MSHKTLFIIGAGASSEVSLPIGDGFKDALRAAVNIRFEGGNMISGDDAVRRALQDFVRSKNVTIDASPYYHAGRHINAALPQAISIDHFLDAHRDNERIELCGKLAIVKTILTAERQSYLYFSPGNAALDYVTLNHTWYGSFLRLLTENCRLGGLHERLSSVALVIFNYDRCVEHFLFHALQNYYGVSGDAIAQLLKQLEIYHPYGVVGPLPWQDQPNPIEFGGDSSPKLLLSLVSEIRTFAEETESPSRQLNAIQDCVRTSGRMVFLGFAFHRMNLDLLMPRAVAPDRPGGKAMYGTALGVSRSNAQAIQNLLAHRSRISDQDVHLERDLKCSKLIDEYWRSLSLVN